MSDVVFILGAGASKACGIPLMSEFLQVSYDLLKDNRVQDVSSEFEAVFDGIWSLESVYSRSSLDLDNIESVFNAFEVARMLDAIPGYSGHDVDKLIMSLKCLISRTIEKTLKMPMVSESGFVDPHHELAKVISEIQDRHRTTAVITFNYDPLVEHALSNLGLVPEYFLEPHKPPEDPLDLDETPVRDPLHVPVLKLHGSLTWGQCRGCGKIVPSTSWTIHNGTFTPPPWFQHKCGGMVEIPYIVPPTIYKTQYYAVLSSVWAQAAKVLSEAESVCIIGYSLPAIDTFFPYLFALSTIQIRMLRRIMFINPDEAAAERFKRLLGPRSERKFVRYGYPFEYKDTFSNIRYLLLPKEETKDLRL